MRSSVEGRQASTMNRTKCMMSERRVGQHNLSGVGKKRTDLAFGLSMSGETCPTQDPICGPWSNKESKIIMLTRIHNQESKIFFLVMSSAAPTFHSPYHNVSSVPTLVPSDSTEAHPNPPPSPVACISNTPADIVASHRVQALGKGEVNRFLIESLQGLVELAQ